MSRAHRSSDAEIADIVDVSRRRNGENGITGLLLSDGYRFLQAIEGEREKLLDCFERIRLDRRHYDVVIVSDEPIGERQFGTWSMQHRNLRSMRDAFKAEVAQDVAEVSNPDLKALFIGFAALSR